MLTLCRICATPPELHSRQDGSGAGKAGGPRFCLISLPRLKEQQAWIQAEGGQRRCLHPSLSSMHRLEQFLSLSPISGCCCASSAQAASPPTCSSAHTAREAGNRIKGRCFPLYSIFTWTDPPSSPLTCSCLAASVVLSSTVFNHLLEH